MAELTRRYVVMPMASEVPFDPHDPDGVFVLKPWKDAAALRAIAMYRDNCYPELARDLDAWILAIAAGPSIRGDVGRRNDPHLRAVKPAVPDAAAAPARPRSAPRPTPARAMRRTVAKAPSRRAGAKTRAGAKRKKRAR
jgi:hypothetical protein